MLEVDVIILELTSLNINLYQINQIKQSNHMLIYKYLSHPKYVEASTIEINAQKNPRPIRLSASKAHMMVVLNK